MAKVPEPDYDETLTLLTDAPDGDGRGLAHIEGELGRAAPILA